MTQTDIVLAAALSSLLQTVTELYPFLAVRDVADAVGFYERAFGAVEEGARSVSPDGSQVALLLIEGHRIAVATEAPKLGNPSPERVEATTVRISLEVDDPDAIQDRAMAEGATEMLVADQPYGFRQGRVVDAYGHHWLFGKPL